MPSDRFVVLGLARPRTPWFSDVARWATSGTLAIDFVKTVSVDELRARLRSGRPFSALLVDASVPGIDRDLLETARDVGCAPIVITSADGRDWTAVGAATALPADLGPTELDAALSEFATPINRVDGATNSAEPVDGELRGFRGRTIAVLGAGGTGTSTVAVAVAQGLAASAGDNVLLADLALHADHAMLHDVRDVIPGLLEVAEAHRVGTPSPEQVRAMTFDIVDRRYRLLLGLRRHRDWTALRPRSFLAAFDSLRRSFSHVVADIDCDFEDEAATGSADVEERNLAARSAVQRADVVVAVGTPGLKGTHSLLRVTRDCLAAGVAPERLVLVVNRAPRRGTTRVESARAIAELLDASHPGTTLLSPVFLPERRHLDQAFRDGIALPEALVAPLRNAVESRLDAVTATTDVDESDVAVLVTPGSLGSWADEEVG